MISNFNKQRLDSLNIDEFIMLFKHAVNIDSDNLNNLSNLNKL